MAGMTRRDFISMAHNYADSFSRSSWENGGTGILWDNLLGFTGIARASNPNFNRALFLREIARSLMDTHGGKGLADFNRLCWNRFGMTDFIDGEWRPMNG